MSTGYMKSFRLGTNIELKLPGTEAYQANVHPHILARHRVYS